MRFKKTAALILIIFMLTLSFSITKPAQAEFSTTPAIAGGSEHSLALKSNGTVWAWGKNNYGQLGDGTTTNKSTPVQVQNLDGVIAIACKGNRSLAVKSDNTVWAWGYNTNGELGDGTTTNKSTPVQVQNLDGVIAIACGGNHSLAVKSNGTIWAWGSNRYYKLGDGTTEDRQLTPVQVKNLTNVITIACGTDYSLALKSDNTVWAWGYNGSGQLGDGTITNKSTPTRIGTPSSIGIIACGASHSLALGTNNSVMSWGSNTKGQLGSGSTSEYRSYPATFFSDVSAIASANDFSLALKTDGTVWAWGDDNNGQLGDGTWWKTGTYKNIPVQVQNLTEAIAVACGNQHSLAVKSDGTVWAWGYGSSGQLGNGTIETRKTTPVQVLGPDGNGYLNLLQSQSSITLNITSPEANTAYSEIAGHNTITVAGTVMEINNNNVTVTAELKNTSGVMVKEEAVTVEQCQSAKEFIIEFPVIEVPEGKYTIEVTATKN